MSNKRFSYSVFRRIARTKLLRKMEDKRYLKLAYLFSMGEKLDFNNVKTFNEKLQWLKLYHWGNDANAIKCADKYAVREYVKSVGREELLNDLLFVWDDARKIVWDDLPQKFVLKCNHNSGEGMYICKDKSVLQPSEISAIRDALSIGLKQDYFKIGREWSYRDIPRKILCEQYMEDNDTRELRDYKFFCFNGVPRIMYISNDLDDEPKTDFFDMDFNRLDMRMRDKNSEGEVEKPEFFEDMKKAAEKLSVGIPQLRVDFYCTKENYYVGELTFFHNGGFSKIYPEKWMKIMGDWIELPNKS